MSKFNNNRMLLGRKARIVAHGFSQIQGVDFENTYIATVRLESFYLLLAIVALKRLHLWYLDFVATYLNSDIDFDVYKTAKGFCREKR